MDVDCMVCCERTIAADAIRGEAREATCPSGKISSRRTRLQLFEYRTEIIDY